MTFRQHRNAGNEESRIAHMILTTRRFTPAQYLKRGATAEAKAASNRGIRDTVESILANIETCGDVAIRDLYVSPVRSHTRCKPGSWQSCT